jgi:hypothetical protein
VPGAVAEPPQTVGHNDGVILLARAQRAMFGVLLACALLTGCTTTVTGTAVRNASTVPSNVPKLDESALKRVLLPIDEVNDLLGTTDLVVSADIKDMTDSSDKVSDPDCLGAMFGAEEDVYKGSGWLAVRDVVAREPEDDNDHWVEQTAVIYPDAGNARRFLEKSRSIWEKCADSSVEVGSDDSNSSLWRFEQVEAGDGIITQVATQEDADGWGCQHALAAASNLTAETWVCAYNFGNEAATMAIDILNKAAEK